MMKSKVRYKHKKTCFTLLATMERDHGIKPGTIFRVKNKHWFTTCNGTPDKDKIIITPPTRGYMSHKAVEVGAHLLFLDVVYDPYARCHLLRFLQGNKIVGFRHTKGKTMSSLKEVLEKVDLEDVEDA